MQTCQSECIALYIDEVHAGRWVLLSHEFAELLSTWASLHDVRLTWQRQQPYGSAATMEEFAGLIHMLARELHIPVIEGQPVVIEVLRAAIQRIQGVDS